MPDNYTSFNSSQLSVNYYNYNSNNVSVTDWKITMFDGMFMQMQLYFSDASLVSTSSIKDKIVITFVENGQFRTESGMVPVNYM